ncbi:MAG TPA: ABC transporter substrate-binding protein [Prolixibacteraceae bacterium]|nr:ABC transporter substrate-binding protein [Prolixibacteraceae bacterium]
MKIRHFLIAAFVILSTLACTQGEKKIKIGYIQITEDPVLNTAKEGLFKALADSGFIDGQNIRIIDNNANGDLSMIITILQSLQSQGVDMIITNSTPCMVSAAQIIKEIPVVFTVAFSPEQVKLKSTPENLYGVYDPYNSTDFVSLMQKFIPGLKKVGLPFNNAEANAEFSAKKLSAEFNARGIEVITANVNSPNDIINAGQYLADKNVDALLAAADNTVYLGLNALANIADEKEIPLFVTDPNQSEKGAAVGMGVNYERWGYLSGQKAVELLKGRTLNKKIEPITEMEFIINQKAATAQKLQIPQDILEKATKVINQ